MRLAAAVLAALAPAAAAASDTPAAKQLGKLVAPARLPGERFGSAIAVDGPAGVVGSPLATPAAVNYVGRVHGLSGAGWTTVADIDASVGATASRQLGTAAALEDPLAVFGAPGYLASAGGVYVHEADQGLWAFSTILPAPMPATDGLVGITVGLAGGRVIAGSLLGAATMPGRAYAWTRLGPGMWSTPELLVAPDPAPDDRFGAAVTVRGDRALIGAPGADGQRGAAYVFEWTGTAWSADAKLVATDRMAGDLFGSAVALDGDLALVGAPGRDGAAGAAYAFERDGDAWIERTPALAPADREPGSLHGRVLALRGPYALVGADNQGADPNQPALGGSGRAVWFGRAADGTWVQLATLAAEDGVPGDRLGWAVALEGDAALLGAPGDDGNLGAVYVFRLEQPDGAACVEPANCTSATCCDGVCLPACESATTGSTGSTTDPTADPTGAAATDATDAPALDLDPAVSPGCACASGHVSKDINWLTLALLALAGTSRRRRRPRGPERASSRPRA